MKTKSRISFLVLILATAWNAAHAQNVKVTPIGQRTGEFCAQDRAILFEDPTGVRILYDPGNTVAGPADARIGAVDVILISHAHSDHLGNARLNQDPNSEAASCGVPATTSVPSTNTAEIAAAKKSAIIAGGPLSFVIGRLIAAVTGSPTDVCPAAGLTNEMTVPRPAACTANLLSGAKRTVRNVSASRGVEITIVTAIHPNDLTPGFLADPERTSLSPAGLAVGLANGFVLTFTNGLKVYLSGDTGLTSDMSTIVRGYYGADLVVMNIGDIFTTGPEEAAFAVTDLLRAVSVIPSHVNEVATQDGIAVSGSRTARFLQLLSRGAGRGGGPTVYLPLSGMTREFDGRGRCEVGCR